MLVFRGLPLPPLKAKFFSEPSKYYIFSFLTLSYLLKVTKLLVKISQLEFLVMTEKKIFVKIATPTFPNILLYQLRSCQASLFESLVGGSTTPPAEMGGRRVHAMFGTHTVSRFKRFPGHIKAKQHRDKYKMENSTPTNPIQH